MSEIARFTAKVDDDEKLTESEITAVPFNSNVTAKYETTHKLENFANIREVGQLKKHLGRIEEIYIGLAKSWKDSEENHDHVIIYLEEQLKTAKANLVDAELTASEEIATAKDQMKALQDKMSKQHENDIVALSNVRKDKEATEQALGEAQEQIAELNANIALHKQRGEQTASELNKRNKELSAANQEINFLKIQLEAEKDILKTTAKNHDQVISFLKEQLRTAEESLAESQVAAMGEVSSTTQQMPVANKIEIVESTDFEAAETEETFKEKQDSIAELKAQVIVNTQKATQEVAEQSTDLHITSQEMPVETTQETTKNTLQDRLNQGGIIKKSPILTAQQTREQLKMRLQGLQEVNELDKRSKEVRTPSQEMNNLKVQTENDNESGKNAIKNQDQGQVVDLKATVALEKQKAEQEISEREKLNKNLSITSQKIDVFW